MNTRGEAVENASAAGSAIGRTAALSVTMGVNGMTRTITVEPRIASSVPTMRAASSIPRRHAARPSAASSGASGKRCSSSRRWIRRSVAI